MSRISSVLVSSLLKKIKKRGEGREGERPTLIRTSRKYTRRCETCASEK